MIPKKETIYFALNEGGLGDQIARMSALDYAIKHYPWLDARIVVPTYVKSLYNHYFGAQKIYTFDEMNKINRRVPITLINSDIVQCSIIRQHLVKHAFSTMLDITPIESDAYNYVKLDLSSINIDKFNLPTNYVVLTTMATVDVREMPKHILEGISKFLILNNLTPVLLGKESASAAKGNDIHARGNSIDSAVNLLNKTTLLEAAKIMSNAVVVIGIDNGLLHLASTTDVPIISGFTTVHPSHRIPMRNGIDGYKYKAIVPSRQLECRFCQSHYNFVYDKDFRHCVEGTLSCIKEMKLDPWISAISDVLIDNFTEAIYN